MSFCFSWHLALTNNNNNNNSTKHNQVDAFSSKSSINLLTPIKTVAIEHLLAIAFLFLSSSSSSSSSSLPFDINTKGNFGEKHQKCVHFPKNSSVQIKVHLAQRATAVEHHHHLHLYVFRFWPIRHSQRAVQDCQVARNEARIACDSETPRKSSTANWS